MSDSRRWITGVDEPLPAGEEVLWSGAPAPRAVARHVLHARMWAAYMGALVVVVGASAASSLTWADTARVLVLPLLLAAFVLGGIALLARLVARTTEYVITSRRIVLRVGIAFPIVINVPLRLVEDAGVRTFGDGSGEVRLALSPAVKLAYIALWPHVETLRGLSHPRPKLRGLADPTAVGAALRQAVAGEGSSVVVGTGGETRRREELRATPFTTPKEAIAG